MGEASNPVEKPSVQFGCRAYELDDHGYLACAEKWDENFAGGMARLVGIDKLTLEHWGFIYYLRRKALEEQTVPVLVQACADNHLRLSRLRFLFPTGYHRGACKIAGINYAFMCRANLWLTYEMYTVLSSEYRLTPAGFLDAFDQWNERFAQIVAAEWKLPDGLTESHWRIIHYLRDFYRRYGNIPTAHDTCKAHRISLAKLFRLFPGGYRRGACRAAGLPFFA